MDQPNVVIVLCDTLRRDVLDIYGGPVSTRPLLEALGGKVVAYLGYSNSFWTIPSHFSLFTGLPVGKHGVHEAPGRNTIEAVMELGRQYRGPTLAWELRRRSYETIGISANPIVSHASGLDRGFRHFIAYEFYFRPPPELGVDEWLDLWEVGKVYHMDRVRAFLGEARRAGLTSALDLAGIYLKELLGRALQFNYVGDKGSATAISILRIARLDEPFLVFVNLMEAHEPYYFGEPPLPPLATKIKGTALGRLRQRSVLGRLTRGYRRSARSCVYAAAWIARALKERGLLQRTLFVFTSDHGQELMEHGALGHNSGHLYEENIGIPIVVKPPESLELAVSKCYVGLHELYDLALSAASGEKTWSPSCGPSIAESYDGVAPGPEAGKGVRRVAVFKSDKKATYRLDGSDSLVEEVVIAGRLLNPRSAEAKKAVEELSSHIITL